MDGPEAKSAPVVEGEAAAMVRQLEEADRQRAIEELHQEYVSHDDIEFILGCSEPGGVVKAACERYEANEGWSNQKEQVKLLWREYKQRIFDAVLNKAERHRGIVENTQAELDLFIAGLDVSLKDANAMTQYMAQGIKLQNTPYEKNAATGQDVMETSELVKMRQFLETLRDVDTDELVEMVDEDRTQLDMLVEMQNRMKAPGRTAPDRLLDPNGNREKYKGDIKILVDFIRGKTPEDKMAKSRFRIQSEHLMWQEIIRNAPFNVRADIIGEHLDQAGLEETKKFLEECICTDALSRWNLLNLYDDHSGRFEDFGNRDEFDAFLRACVAKKMELERRVAEQIEQIEDPSQVNAVTYFFTFDKMIGETLFRIGALAGIANIALNIADGVVHRDMHSESWMTGALKGAGRAAKDSYVIGSIAVALLGSNLVYPWWKRWAYAPSGEEGDKLAQFQAGKFLKEQATNHHEVMDYFADNYERYIKIARLNERNENPNQKPNEKRGGFDLWKEDIKLTPQQAGELGYASVEMAQGAIINMFGACARIFKLQSGKGIEDANDFRYFLTENGLYVQNDEIDLTPTP
ncbi:MAG: hypothetical protein AAB588_02480 [Patescibacteria group bacterium]